MTAQKQIAAALRGFTFDGAKGLLVRSLPAGFFGGAGSAGVRLAADAFVEAPRLKHGQPLDQLELARMARVLRNYGGSAVPRLVTVAGIGDFLIGQSLDELDEMELTGQVTQRLERVMPEPGTSGSREAVVSEKVAVVTGGAQGLGAEIARILCAAGATVVVADLNSDGAVESAAQLNSRAGRRVAFPCAVDVTDEISVSAMIATISAAVGGIDLFVSNAGVLKAGSVTALSLYDFDSVTRVNYTGFFLCTKHTAPLMAMQWRAARTIAALDAEAACDGGTARDSNGSADNRRGQLDYFSDIIQINSKSGLEGSNRNGAYAGAKFGAIGLVQSFAKELVTDGIKVNAICPGNFFEGPLWSDPDRGLFVEYLRAGKVPGANSIADVKRYYEQQVPMGRGCHGEDVVRAILYVVEQKYETGQAVPVTGGQVMLS